MNLIKGILKLNLKKLNNSFKLKGWYCECKNGARTLGCCCHIASVIYFLALGRYSIDHFKWSANNLTSIFPFDFEDEEPLKPNLKISTQKRRTKKLDFEISSSDFDAESENESEKEAEIELRCSKRIKQSQSIQKIKEVNIFLYKKIFK